MEIIVGIIAAVVGIAAGAGGVFVYNKKNENGGKNKADDIVRKAKNEASDIVSNAKKDAADIAKKASDEEAERRKEWKKNEDRLSERETLLDGKLDQIDKRQENIIKQEKEIASLKDEVRQIRDKQQEKLEKIAGLSKADAKDKLMKMTEKATSFAAPGLTAAGGTSLIISRTSKSPSSSTTSKAREDGRTGTGSSSPRAPRLPQTCSTPRRAKPAATG